MTAAKSSKDPKDIIRSKAFSSSLIAALVSSALANVLWIMPFLALGKFEVGNIDFYIPFLLSLLPNFYFLYRHYCDVHKKGTWDECKENLYFHGGSHGLKVLFFSAGVLLIWIVVSFWTDGVSFYQAIDGPLGAFSFMMGIVAFPVLIIYLMLPAGLCGVVAETILVRYGR